MPVWASQSISDLFGIAASPLDTIGEIIDRIDATVCQHTTCPEARGRKALILRYVALSARKYHTDPSAQRFYIDRPDILSLEFYHSIHP